MSFVHLHTLLAAEEQLRSEFQMRRRMLSSQDTRRLYNMVTAVENIHVTMLESLDERNAKRHRFRKGCIVLTVSISYKTM